MKKFLLMIVSAFMLSTSSWAWTLVPLSVHMPKVYIEDYTLMFGINHPEYTLILKDENDNIVYTTTVFTTQTDVILPSTLSGDYQIELIMDDWLFVGEISLN